MSYINVAIGLKLHGNNNQVELFISVKKGSLIVAGTGIKSIAHLTLEARAWICEADIVLHCLADPVTAIWVRDNSKQSLDLNGFYQDNQPRLQTYLNMSACIMQHVREGLDVCAVFYGHPGIFVMASHHAIALARAEGYRAAMLPAISAEDCLFAELGFDPATYGCQSLEATDMLLRKRVPQVDEHVVIWQAGSVGELDFHTNRSDNPFVTVLVEYLTQFYPASHPVFHYQGAQYPVSESAIEYLTLADLNGTPLSTVSTLYLPPAQERPIDRSMAAKLGIQIAEELPAHSASKATDIPPLDIPPPHEPLPAQSGLADLLTTLAEQPRALADFRLDPNLAVKLYGNLDSAEVRTLLQGEASDIRRNVLAGGTHPRQFQSGFDLTTGALPTAMEAETAAELFEAWQQSPQHAADYAESIKQTLAGALPQNLQAHLRETGCELTPATLDAALPEPAATEDNTAQYVRQVIHLGALAYSRQTLDAAHWIEIARLKASIPSLDEGLSIATPHPRISQRDADEEI